MSDPNWQVIDDKNNQIMEMQRDCRIVSRALSLACGKISEFSNVDIYSDPKHWIDVAGR